ncbi:MAG: YciI family protein [Bacteroidota bacterium]
MKKFLLLLHDDTEQMSQLSPKDMEELVAAHMAWAEELGKSGHLIEGEGLEEKSVRITGKDAIIQDGNFLESKEIIGGFYYLQAKDLDEAIELSKSCPCHLWGGTTEIRPVMEYDG